MAVFIFERFERGNFHLGLIKKGTYAKHYKLSARNSEDVYYANAYEIPKSSQNRFIRELRLCFCVPINENITLAKGVFIGSTLCGPVYEYLDLDLKQLSNFLLPQDDEDIHFALCSVYRDVACGASFMHSNGIVHGNLKMESILLDKRTMTAKISDFGLSSIEDAFVEGTANKRRHIIPEMLVDNLDWTHASDVFQYGLVMFEASTGSDLSTDGFYLDSVRNYTVKSFLEVSLPSYSNRHLQGQLPVVINACCEPKPSDRKTFSEIHSQWNDFLQQEDILMKLEKLKACILLRINEMLDHGAGACIVEDEEDEEARGGDPSTETVASFDTASFPHENENRVSEEITASTTSVQSQNPPANEVDFSIPRPDGDPHRHLFRDLSMNHDVQRKWRQIGEKLKFEDYQLDDITSHRFRPYDRDEWIYYVFREWRIRNRQPTRQWLLDVLLSEGCTSVLPLFRRDRD